MSIAAAAILVVNLVLLVAPRGGTREASAAGELTVALADDPVLDPHRGGLPASWLAARALHRGLYAFPHDAAPAGSVPQPDLALALPEQVAARTYELTVRPATFSNGRTMSTADVVASIRRLQRTGVGLSRFLAPIETVRTIGTFAERRVEITTTRTMPELAWLLAHPQAAVVPSTTPWRVSPDGPPGLGPYRVQDRSLQRRLVFVRNAHWIAAQDPIRAAIADRIVLDVVNAGPATVAAVSGDDANLIGDPGPPDVFSTNVPTRVGGRCTRLLAVDHRASGLDRLAVRRRIAHSLRGIDLTTPGTRPADGILPPHVTGARTSPRSITGVGGPAARMLTLAGSATPRDARELADIAEELRGAGFSIAIEKRTPGLHARLLRASSESRPDLVLFTWCAEWPGLAGRAFFDTLTGPGALVPRTSTITERLNAARVAGSATAADRWAAVEAAVADTAILIPVGWPAEIAAFSGFDAPPSTSPMWPQGDPTNLDPAG